MSQSIEERLWNAHKADTELRRLFNAYTDSRNDSWGLLHTLSSVQKDHGYNWIVHVNAVMQAMEVHDAGMFPERWLNELEGGSA